MFHSTQRQIVSRVAPVDSSINSSGYFNITMPPGGTQIPMYVGNSTTTSAVDNNGILFNASAALFYIPDGNVATHLNNFRIVRTTQQASNWDFDVKNSNLICVQTITNTESFIKWMPGQNNIPWGTAPGFQLVSYNNANGE